MGWFVICDESEPFSTACFGCNTSDVAFGPLMPSRGWALAFAAWLKDEKGRRDPRSVEVNDLCGLWADFAATHQMCSHCDAIITDRETMCADCAETYEARADNQPC